MLYASLLTWSQQGFHPFLPECLWPHSAIHSFFEHMLEGALGAGFSEELVGAKTQLSFPQSQYPHL